MSAPHEFFISYTQVDRGWAEWIAWILETKGYSVIIQSWDMPAGTNFVVALDEASTGSKRTIAVLSPEYQQSGWAKVEWSAALAVDPIGKAQKLLPIRIRAFDPTGIFGSISYVDLVDCDESTATQRLLATVERSRAKPPAKPSFPSTPKPTFPSTPMSVWRVPARNLNFTGRTEWLDRLQQGLRSNERTVVTQAVKGLGGIGKSQLVTEYAHRHRQEYRIVWWIRAESRELRERDLGDLARALMIPDVETMTVDRQLAELRSSLERTDGWLLIFDNVEKPTDVTDLLPQAGAGHVLITSRYGAWGDVAAQLSLTVWSPEEAIAYLNRRTAQVDASGAAALSDDLGYLPLALEQAAAYIDESQISIQQYTTLFRNSRVHLLKAASDKTTVATIWELSLQRVTAESRNAVTLLQICSFLPPDSFPRQRLHRPGGQGMPPQLRTVLADEVTINDAIAVLRRYSLLDATPEHVSVHRLVQTVVRERMDNREHRAYSDAALKLQHATDYSSDEPESTPSDVDARWLSWRTGVALLTVLAISILGLAVWQYRRGNPTVVPKEVIVAQDAASTAAMKDVVLRHDGGQASVGFVFGQALVGSYVLRLQLPGFNPKKIASGISSDDVDDAFALTEPLSTLDDAILSWHGVINAFTHQGQPYSAKVTIFQGGRPATDGTFQYVYDGTFQNFDTFADAVRLKLR